MAKDLQKVKNSYSSILEKVDIIVRAVTNIAQSYNSMILKIDGQAELNMKFFGNIDVFLGELKTMLSTSSSSSLFTHEFLTHKFRMPESTIHSQLDPLSKLLNVLPTDAPPVITGVQGGERKVD
ncbi:unnamed protein product [Lactuca saligna]|uniref:Uncharacterized protein n=1 Tax=Lactuca saligna TaxID=75948 RepID=A0AA35YPB2_LACSI|nr:unnamed protein product [Lactuca saligna]